jgi:hypothetical protein
VVPGLCRALFPSPTQTAFEGRASGLKAGGIRHHPLQPKGPYPAWSNLCALRKLATADASSS